MNTIQGSRMGNCCYQADKREVRRMATQAFHMSDTIVDSLQGVSA